MGCNSSKESAPHNSKRAVLYGSNSTLPTQRYLADPPRRKPVASKGSSNDDTHGSGEAARPNETFDAYARRGIIGESALGPEATESKGKEHLSRKKEFRRMWEVYP